MYVFYHGENSTLGIARRWGGMSEFLDNSSRVSINEFELDDEAKSKLEKGESFIFNTKTGKTY